MKLFGYKLSFKEEKKKDIIFFDNNYAEIKIRGLKSHFFDYKRINILILLKTLQGLFLHNFKIPLKYIYLKKFLETTNPKIVIGHHLNDVMYKIKQIDPKLKTIIYLHHRLYLDQILELKKKYNKSKVDYFFVCDLLHKKKISNFISSKFIINGLTKNNEINTSSKKKKFDLMIISEYRNLPKNHFYSRCIQFVSKTISNYAKKKNFKVLIALNTSRKEKKFDRKKEINFFKEINPAFYFTKFNSYQNAEYSRLNICLASNLGADLLARGHKVLFLPFLAKYSRKYKNMYLLKNSEFVYNKENSEEIFKKIDELLRIKNIDWKNLMIKSNIKFIFDKQNKIMKKIIKKIIVDDRKNN